ncbi:MULTISPECIES: MFS transporter [unclassified Arthrobacter]|uniref:MFS transporter n=1 Tax=unclassified Arthrobacter TaxID=235627 RepID=UPI00210330BE|nr:MULTISPECIES: MFS transporter [unclassified Arthrobacter]MCQ1946249.1 MHS family MFS transporter [Arthrobacter sp. zg-Y1116]MCQ1986190.1 MHS family MFS transporter [Arthrobacter sp. zg-Y844]MCQ1994071.1 MHS family MFS transporter [Arthrobacter sp. zg-Y1171]UWX81822.1 MHS family MFS transporter [Arthrobacter sp. zg-Y1171]
MSSAPDAPAAPALRTGKNEARRVILSSYLGSTIEFYDFLLYASASALVFPHVFFTNLDPLAGTIASYGTFAAGYLARPLGGAVFGHFGDRLGRKKMLILSMLIMGIASTLIGLIPSANTIGSWGAVILILLRVCQGIAVGGEWGGAALMALEHSAKGKRGFAASFTNAGAPTGAALGTFILGLFASMPEDQFLSWGWRVPFLLSALLLVVGLFVRSRVSESPIFKAAVEKEAADQGYAKPKLPILQVLRRPRALIFTMLGGASGFALQVFLATFAVSYAVEHGAERQSVLYVFAAASILSVAFVVGMGRLSDRLGRRPVMVAGLVLFIAMIFPMFSWLSTGNVWLIFAVFMLGLLFHAAIYGPLAAFISEQFGTTARYTGASLGYQFATLLGAGFTPGILSSIYASSGRDTGPVVWYLAGMALISAIFILLTRESKDYDLETHEH